jgi:hypothetical protein
MRDEIHVVCENLIESAQPIVRFRAKGSAKKHTSQKWKMKKSSGTIVARYYTRIFCIYLATAQLHATTAEDRDHQGILHTCVLPDLLYIHTLQQQCQQTRRWFSHKVLLK